MATIIAPPPQISSQKTEKNKSVHASAPIGVLVLVLSTVLVFQMQRPPAAGNTAAGAADFSSARAFEHVRQIALKPHPPGSAEHIRVREVIRQELVKLGLNPEIETGTAANPRIATRFRTAVPAGTVENIIARLPGRDSTKAILLTAHYDSVQNAPGAADNGSGVAALLETVRALKAGKPLRNDVVFLFTDGEEAGSLGARLFAQEHAHSLPEFGLVLNLDARGVAGQAWMFETTAGNQRLIQEFAGTAPYPSANSFTADLYKLLAADTDFTELKHDALYGMNFAFIEIPGYYHGMGDSEANLDQRSLQQEGANLLALVRDFGEKDFRASPQATKRDSVYFNLPGWILVRYSHSFVWPMFFLAASGLIVATLVAYSRKQVSLLGILFGMLISIGNLIFCFIAINVMGVSITSAHAPHWAENVYRPGAYEIATLALAFTMVCFIYILALSRSKPLSLAVGSLWIFLGLLAIASALAPGMTYLVFWPLLAGLAPLAWQLYAKSDQGRAKLVLDAVCAITAILILGPAIYLIHQAIPLKGTALAGIVTALLLSLLVPQIYSLRQIYKWILPGVGALAVIFFVALGGYRASFDAQHPIYDTLVYAADPDHGEAIWATSDPSTDSWTSQFIGKDATKGELPKYSLYDVLGRQQKLLYAHAPSTDLRPPALDILEDRTTGSERVLRLRLRSQRRAPELTFTLTPQEAILDATCNGVSLMDPAPLKNGSAAKDWRLHYFGLPEQGIEVQLRLRAGSPVSFTLVDGSYGFPSVANTALPARSSINTPRPFVTTEETLITHSGKF